MQWLVYAHVSPSNKVYIGITSKKPEYRWNNGLGYKGCRKFFNAIVKYGWSNIRHYIIAENLTKAQACLLEQQLIAYHKRLGISYNITDGGEGTVGVHRDFSLKHKEQLSYSHQGLHHSLTTRQKMSKSRAGKKQTKEWVNKRAESHRVPIIAISPNGNKIIFNSIKEASLKLNVEQRNISAVCRGLRKTAGKYKFLYYDNK